MYMYCTCVFFLKQTEGKDGVMCVSVSVSVSTCEEVSVCVGVMYCQSEGEDGVM